MQPVVDVQTSEEPDRLFDVEPIAHAHTESAEVVECREERIKRLSKYDSTVFLSRVIQIMGIKKPTLSQQDLKADPPLTVKDKIRRELQTCITKAGHQDTGTNTNTSYADNRWRLDEEWFDHN